MPLSPGAHEQRQGIRLVGTLIRQLNVMVAALGAVTFQTHAAGLDWFFDVGNNDEIAREQARFLVWDGVSHSSAARLEKVKIVDKDWPFYLFNVVMTNSGTGGRRDRSSYLVCFKLAENSTEFRIVTVIQHVSEPPTEHEIAIDKRLNRWPVSPPWKVEDELPHKIRGSGLEIVLDKCRAESGQ